MPRLGERAPADRRVDQREAHGRRLEGRDAGLVVGPFDLGARIDAVALRLDPAQDAQRRDARHIWAALDLRARHVGGDVADDGEAADLRQPRARLRLETPDARVALEIAENGKAILLGAG